MSKARQAFRADMDRFFAHFETPPTLRQRIRFMMRTEGVWAVFWFRFGQYVRREASFPVRLVLELPLQIAEKWIGHTLGIHLYTATEIGPGFYIGHYGGIWVSPRARIGANCSISQGVTIGVAGRDRSRGPELGDRVWIGPNAVVTGKIRVGSGAVIGANSLVACNVPENGVALGVPARVVGYSGSGSLIVLPKSAAGNGDGGSPFPAR